MNNQLKNVSSNVFSHLTNLQVLNLSSNSIEIMSHNSFANLTKLKYLSLRQNKLGDQLSIFDENINDQIPIDVVNNLKMQPYDRILSLTLIALDVIYLPNVHSIDLRHNKFHVILRSTSPFSTLRRGKEFATVGSDHTLRTWPKLEELSLDGCAMEFLQDGSFDGLISLSILRLNDNSLKVGNTTKRKRKNRKTLCRVSD